MYKEKIIAYLKNQLNHKLLLTCLFIMTSGMGFALGSMTIFLYYLLVSGLFYLTLKLGKSNYKHMIFLLSIILIYISPIIFDIDMEHFEEVFLILPIIFIILYPRDIKVILINMILISMYFVYPGDEALYNIIEDSLELFVIGTLAIITSYQFYTLKNKMDQLDYESNHDLVCMIGNKSALLKKLSLVNKEKESYDLLLFEIKDYRIIRDVFGYDHSNQLLKTFSDIILSKLSTSDQLFRVGPEEFAIMHLRSKEDINVSHMLMNFYKESIHINGNQHNISLNIGMASSPEDSIEAIILFSLASYALRVSKSKGTNQFVKYKIEFSQEVEKLVDLVNEIQIAIDREEFRPYYQPKLCSRSNKIVGVEALVRWHHPDKGIVMPGDFINVCEQSGLIVQLGYQVIHKACQDFKKIKTLIGDDFRLSINISVVQLRLPNFSKIVLDILKSYDVDPNHIEFEITESFLIDNIGNIHYLDDFRKSGILISMDDFGMQYSSFAYLKSLPVDVIKLDRMFIKDITKSETDKAIFSTMVQLGHQLSLSVIAEGVETVEQLKIVQSSSCQQYQGYLFSKAIPIDQLIECLNKYPPE